MNGVGLQEPAIDKKPTGAHGLNLSALAVRERSVTLFFLLAIIIAGAVAYLTLGRAEDPTFTRPGLAFLAVTLLDYTPPDQVAEQFYQVRKKIQDEASKLPKGVLTPVLNDEYTDVKFAVYALKARQLPLRLLTR